MRGERSLLSQTESKDVAKSERDVFRDKKEDDLPVVQKMGGDMLAER